MKERIINLLVKGTDFKTVLIVNPNKLSNSAFFISRDNNIKLHI